MNITIKISLTLILICSSLFAQNYDDLKRRLVQLDNKIKTVEELASRYNNQQAVQLIRQAREKFDLAVNLLTQQRIYRARAAFVEADKLADQAAKIVTFKSAVRVGNELNKLIRRAEQVVHRTGKDDARYMLNKAKAFQIKAEQSYKNNRFIEAQQYSRVATYFAEKAIQLAEGKQTGITRPSDFNQYLKDIQGLLRSAQMNPASQNQIKNLLQKARLLIKQAREKYEQGDEKQALIYLQMSERLLHRAVDLGQDTDRGVQESIRNNLISLNRYITGIENSLDPTDNINRSLLNKARSFYRGAQRDFNNGNYQAARSKVNLSQRMASKALRITKDDQIETQTQLLARIREAENLLQLQREKSDTVDQQFFQFLTNQAERLINKSKTSLEGNRPVKAFRELQFALRILNRIESARAVEPNLSRKRLTQEFSRISRLVASFENKDLPDFESSLTMIKRMLKKAENELNSGRLREAYTLLEFVENQINLILKDAVK